MRWEQQIQYAAISDIGFRRRNNQDAQAVRIASDFETWKQRGHVLMVADGMGGHAVGELASKIAVDTVPHAYLKDNDRELPSALRNAVETANTAIFDRGMANREFLRMGTTCTVLTLSRQGVVIGHVGDSRAYRIRGSRIDQLTFDHSLQWELIRQGHMKPEEVYLHEPRNVITRSLGPEPSIRVDIEGPFGVVAGDTYLLCSDGLTSHLRDDEIGMIAHELPPGDACRLLVNLANLRGGSDNITVVISRVGPVPEGIAPEEPDTDSLNHAADHGLSWQWLFAFWAVALLFAAGVCATLFGRPLFGGALVGSAIVGVGALVYFRLANRLERVPVETGGSETVIWRPYRSASARLTPAFLKQLSVMESELQRTAVDEGWSIDWAKHEQHFQKARAAMNERKSRRALRAYAAAIDVLMAGIHLQRKQDKQDGRRSGRDDKTPIPPPKT